jgi:hypothetical protein
MVPSYRSFEDESSGRPLMIDLRKILPERGTTLTVALRFAFVLAIIWFLNSSISTGDYKCALKLGAAAAALAIAGKTLSDWRSGFYIFLTWLLFEDLIRKYLGNSMYVYFAKDSLVGLAYVALLMARLRGEDKERFKPPFKYAFGLFFLLATAQVFNPGSPSLWYGVLGMKLYFYYVPLMFVGYGLIRAERDLQRFLVVSMALAAVISIVGILQSIIGLDFLNPRGSAEIDELGHLVRYTPSGLAVPRPPSVFVSDGRFASYLILAFILGLGTAGYLLLRTKWGRTVVFPALAVVGLAALLSGSRGCISYVVISALVLSAVILWGAPPTLVQKYHMARSMRRSLMSVALAVSLAVALFPGVVSARWTYYRETILPGSDSETENRMWAYPLVELQKALSDGNWLSGHGTGTASLGTQYVTGILGAPAGNWGVESGPGVLTLEMGILGPILWALWASSLLFSAAKIVIKLKGTWAFPVAVSIIWFVFLLLFPFTYGGIQPYQNFVYNAYLWLLVGILFKLPKLIAEHPRLQSIVDSQQ